MNNYKPYFASFNAILLYGVAVAQRDQALPLADSPKLTQLRGYLSGRPLTLNDAIQISLVTSRPLAAAKANLLVFQGRTSEAYAAFNPTLTSGIAAIKLNDKIQSKTLTALDPKNFNQPIGAEVTTSNVQQKLVGVTANLPVDISGTIHAATDQARFQEQALRFDLDRTRNQVIAEVKSAFYDVLRAQALAKVSEESLKNTQDRLKDAEDRLAARVVTKFDVLRAHTDVAATQQKVIVARNTVKTAVAILSSVLGLKVDEAIEITDRDAVSQPKPDPTLLHAEGGLGDDYNRDLKEALATRPELKEADAIMGAAKKGITLARRSELPTFNLSWSYLYAPNAAGSTPIFHSWQAQALFSLPIFDGGVSKARMQEAKGSLAGSEVAKRQAIDQVTLEVEQAYLSVLESEQRVGVANETLDEATEAFNLAKVRYKAGVSSHAGISPLLEISDAQAALTLAESNQVNALYDFNSATSRLDRAIGRFAK